MNKLFLSSVIATILFSISITTAYAQTDEFDVVADAGVTPDSFLYGLDVAFDNLTLQLASEDKKIEVGLKIASERLSEVKLMIDAKRTDHAETAKEHHDRVIEDVETRVLRINSDNASVDAKLTRNIEADIRIQAHKERIETMEESIKLKIKTEGDIPMEQLGRLNTLLESLDDGVKRVEIEIEDEKIKTEMEFREDRLKTEFQLERINVDLEKEIREKIRDGVEIEHEDGDYDKENIVDGVNCELTTNKGHLHCLR
jgi:hypothetical protein